MVVELVDTSENVEVVVVEGEGAVETGGVGAVVVMLDATGVVSGGVASELVSAAGARPQAAVTSTMVNASRENRIVPLLDPNHLPDN